VKPAEGTGGGLKAQTQPWNRAGEPAAEPATVVFAAIRQHFM